ncbi:MAG: hypothetical protein QOD71_390 [Thermoleophilaceae bacterium]|nr:hypothetical protein [Thermoleophilaceae bacterium]
MAILAVALVALVALGAVTARANEFNINACQADRGEFSTQAFEDFANRGMMWKRACDPEGPGLRGLVTANVVRAGRVVRGSRSFFILKAPDGTRFSRLTWSGQARRQDCRYALQLWADRPDGSTVAIKNVRANRGCPNAGRAQAAGWPSAHTYDIGGATKIVQRVLCVGADGTPYCSSRGLNYIRTFKAQATVLDVSPPGVSITQDNAFTRGEWVNGTQQVGYATLDNVGVRVVRPVFAGSSYGDSLRPCNYAQRVPCPNGPGSLVVDTTNLAEGSQAFALQAEDAAGNLGQSSTAVVRVDNTAPGAVPIEIEGGDVWRNRNAFDVAWTNAEEADRAPITAAHYRLCPIAGGDCVTARHLGEVTRVAALAVPSPGEWQLRIWREDGAGNQEPANASVPVTLRYDPEPPELGFEDPSSSDPTLVSAVVTDEVSGLAGGQIELGVEGSGTWQSLPTRQAGNRLVARIDDARVPAGRYVLRATARDQAANQSSTDLRLDGQPMTITLPLRTPTSVTAGVATQRRIRGRDRRRRSRHRRTVLVPRARVPLGGQVTIVGQVRSRDGQPVPGADISVLSRSATSPERALAVLRTDQRGRYTYDVRARATSVLRVLYAGTSTRLPSQREVALLVPAASTIATRPRRVLNGQAVTFVGRLRSLPIPAAGKLVELQVVLSDRWQTFRTVRTDASGIWRVRYRFRRSCGLLRYRFRARLPAESGYPFESGHTRPIGVRVRGEPCR